MIGNGPIKYKYPSENAYSDFLISILNLWTLNIIESNRENITRVFFKIVVYVISAVLRPCNSSYFVWKVISFELFLATQKSLLFFKLRTTQSLLAKVGCYFWLIDWLIYWLIDWFIDWLIDSFVFNSVSASHPINGGIFDKWLH